MNREHTKRSKAKVSDNENRKENICECKLYQKLTAASHYTLTISVVFVNNSCDCIK